jgi:selenoprotein W-related protein
LAAKLLSTYKQKIQGLELEPSGGGCFELTVGNDLVYSKLKTGEFPNEEEMVTAVGKRLKPSSASR